MTLTEKVLLGLFDEELPQFDYDYFIEECEVDNVTELYNTYLEYKKEYNKDLIATDFDKWMELHDLITDIVEDITGECLYDDEIQIKNIGE